MSSHLRSSGRTGTINGLKYFQRRDYRGTKGSKSYVSSGAGGRGEGEKHRRGESSDGPESSSDDDTESSRETEDRSDAEDSPSESDTGDSMSERNTKGTTSESDTEDSPSENEVSADGVDGRSTRKPIASQSRFRHSSNMKSTN